MKCEVCEGTESETNVFEVVSNSGARDENKVTDILVCDSCIDKATESDDFLPIYVALAKKEVA